jgi:hypothetical protein
MVRRDGAALPDDQRPVATQLVHPFDLLVTSQETL